MTLQDISQGRFTNGKLNLRRFHQARWDEPVIFELSSPGQRGILMPEVEPELRAAAGDVLAALPPQRATAPAGVGPAAGVAPLRPAVAGESGRRRQC
jgi:glycine dehydrogenase subunit 2